MHDTARHIDKQLRILYVNWRDDHGLARGRFKKQNAMDCGRSHCCLCGNPRDKGWGEDLTFQEIKAKQAADYDLKHLYDEEDDA